MQYAAQLLAVIYYVQQLGSEVARVLESDQEVPDHEEIKSQEKTKNASTVSHQGEEGESQLLSLQEDCLAAEDERDLGESSIWS